MVINTNDIKVPATRAINLFLLLFLLFGLIIWAIISLFYKVQFESIEDSIATQETQAIQVQKIELENSLSEVVSDLFFLSAQNELLQYINTGNPLSIPAIEKEYSQLLLRKKKYDQIRYLDNTGQETVRVNYHSGLPAAVAQKDLQNKQQRYYFKNTFRLRQGEIFISPMDLNIEHGKIEQPLKPVIRVGTPIFNAKKEKYGIILINVLAKNILDILRKDNAITNGHPMLLNKKGYWLYNNDQSKAWGFMFKERKDISFARLYPQEWQIMLKQKTGQIKTDRGMFTFTLIHPPNIDTQWQADSPGELSSGLTSQHSSDYFWILVSYVSPELLDKHITPLQIKVFFLGLGLFVVVALGAWILAFSIIKRRSYQEHLISMALHDTLTHLPNRKYFFNRLEEGLSHAERYKTQLALLYIDLDGFKAINDTFGHKYGDELLIRISETMVNITRKTDTVARLGGDEFAIILFQVDSREGALRAGEKLIEKINRPIRLPCGEVHVGASIGIALYPDASKNAEELVKLADQSMYISKSRGKNRCTFSSAI